MLKYKMPEYTLYTFPNCQKCSEVKEILSQMGIRYHEINAGLDEGRKIFREFFEKNKESIERDSRGQITLPIFINGSRVIQGLDKIIDNL